MNTSGEKSDINRNKKITFERKLIFKRSSFGRKDIKMTLSQEEIIKLGDYLNLNNHQNNLLSSLNIKGEDNIIRQKLSVLEKHINKSDT